MKGKPNKIMNKKNNTELDGDLDNRNQLKNNCPNLPQEPRRPIDDCIIKYQEISTVF